MEVHTISSVDSSTVVSGEISGYQLNSQEPHIVERVESSTTLNIGKIALTEPRAGAELFNSKDDSIYQDDLTTAMANRWSNRSSENTIER